MTEPAPEDIPGLTLHLEKLFKVVCLHLWPAIARSGLGGNTYARCVLTSCAIRDFAIQKGYEARVIPAILDVSLRRGTDLAHPVTLGIGEPNADQGKLGIHVVCELTDRSGGRWTIDGSTRQAARPDRWRDPPEVVVARNYTTPQVMQPDDQYFKLGFAPLASTSVEQGDGARLLFQWLVKDGYPDLWSSSPDAAAERSTELSKRLVAAWSRSR